MKVLVTGGGGFVGSHMAAALAETGLDVTALYRRETPFLHGLRERPTLRLMCGDLGKTVATAGPFDAVVHAAAVMPGSGTGASKMVRDNVEATLWLADAAVKWNARAFLYFSSISLYGDISLPELDEGAPVVNPGVYGMTKLLGEKIVADTGAPALALRLPGVLGPGAHSNWLSTVAARLRDGRPVEAFGLGAAFNNAAHVADIASLAIRTLAAPFTGFDAVILGARETVTIGAAIERLAAGLGVRAEIIQCPPKKPFFTLSSRRAIERWGYDPMTIGAMIDRFAHDVRSTA